MLNILIIGGGMYVTGRGTKTFGTVLPALVEASKSISINQISVVTTNKKSAESAKLKYLELENFTNQKLNIKFSETSEIDSILKNFETMNGIKLAIIATPDHTHFNWAKDLANQGFHLLVVKPLVPTSAEATTLINLLNSKKLFGATEFHKRFDRSNLKLKEAIKTKAIGEPLSFLVQYSQKKSIPLEKFKDWSNHTNIFQYLAVHYADIIYWATKATPLRVMAIGQKNFLKENGLDNYDSIQAIIEWKNDKAIFTSTIHCNWIDPEKSSAMSDQRISVVGTLGRMELDQKYRGIIQVNDQDGILEPNPDFCSFYENSDGKNEARGYGIESIVQFLKDVVDLKNAKTSLDVLENNRPSFKDSLASIQIVEAVNLSLSQNSNWILIKDLK